MVLLHVHNSDSLLDGLGTQLQNAKKAASLGHSALAESNHANLNGSLKHIKACEKVGIMPICGNEMYWRPDRGVRTKEWRFSRWHMVMHAKNLRGWHNLMRLTSASYADGFFQSPCIDWDLMERHREGVICSTACVLGPLAHLIQNGTDREVNEWITRAKKIYGEDLYFAIMPHDFDNQRSVNLEMISLAAQHGVPIVFEGDSHYPEQGWVDTQKIAILIGTNSTYQKAEEANRKRRENGEEIYELWHDGLHIMSEDEVRASFACNHPDISADIVDEAIANTDMVASKVEPFLLDRSLKMPRVKFDAERQVRTWCREGMERIGKVGDTTYESRLEYELDVIKKRRNMDYFAITGDWVRWCRSDAPLPATPSDPQPQPKSPMLLGSGRGSCAGSLVSYLCKITTVDPITHKFKFERFLNPERKGLPDIDIDFPSSRRGEGKEYLSRKYGNDYIADVLAQQHFQPRAALKSVTKVIYGYDSDAYRVISEICHEDSGLIDAVHDTDLTKLRERIKELDIWAMKYPDAWLHAVRLENGGEPYVTRISKHAGGVVITPGPISDYMATLRSDEDEVGFRTAWAETPSLSIVDEYGFVKWDALGIKGKDQQQMIVDLVKKTRGETIDIDALPCLRNPYDVDPAVMKAFHDGHTLGVNQFSGHGITEFIKRARPQNLVDLTAINALYRPGPMGVNGHWEYARRRNGEIEYDIAPLLEPVLGDTFGSISFQEQVMELFEVLVGYSAGKADGIRKIIAKLYREKGDLAELELDKHRELFIDSAAAKLGIEAAEDYWGQILPYTDYSFNRAHAGGYSVQAYQDQWLKVKYSPEFYAVLMTLDEGASVRAIREARQFGVKVLPPDVNISKSSYTVVPGQNDVVFGLVGIKGVGDAAAKQVMEGQPYDSMGDFEKRMSVKYSKCNKKVRQRLVEVGALDALGGRSDWSDQQKSNAELEILGVALTSGGTLGDHERMIIEATHSEEEYNAMPMNSEVAVGGVITELRKTKTKRGRNPGQEMCFLKLSLGLDEFRCTCFPGQYAIYKPLLSPGSQVIVKGRKEDRGIIVDAMISVGDFVQEMQKRQTVST